MNIDTDRLDKVMVELDLVSSRTKAQSLIKQSAVLVNGHIITKPNTIVHFDDTIEITNDPCPWVSRGGLKLDYALTHFKISVKQKTALDIGASTGGFSHVLLHHGIDKVFAVDVGTNQLHPSLKHDHRIISMEQTDARDLSPCTIPSIDIIVADVSFVSLTKIITVPLDMVIQNGVGIFLIKPQFEVGKAHIGKQGIVSDMNAINTCIENIKTFFTQQKWTVQSVEPCPTLGANGNQEYILYAIKQ